MNLDETYVKLRRGARVLETLSAKQKNVALQSVAKSLDKNRKSILDANALDVDAARASGVSESLVDRLSLNDKRLSAIIDSIFVIINQTDPVGTVDCGWTTPEGLSIRQVRVPIGVCAIIYESRPNVTVDAFAIAYKSGNAILLRGSSSALNSNRAIVAAIKVGLETAALENGEMCGVPDAIALADSGERSEVDEILGAVGKIDVVLPRGGANLIKMVVQKARVPVIETGSGICHIFVDESAELDKAAKIAENAKLQRPGVCNAAEVLLVHEKIAEKFLPLLAETFASRAELRCDEKSLAILRAVCISSTSEKTRATVLKVADTNTDYDTEFLDYVMAIKIVGGVNEAIEHINKHNTKHSEAIVTQNVQNAREFQKRVDAACVYVNASTRFTDGGVFGYGAELGISTQKLHIRGPMGLTALTTTKYLIEGEGNIRQ